MGRLSSVGVAVEAVSPKQREYKSSGLKRPLSLRSRGERMVVDPDGAIRSFDSTSERRSLFGREALFFYKVQVGVVIQAPRTEWSLRAAPRLAQFVGRPFDGVEVSQTVEFFRGTSSGFTKRVKLKNISPAPVRLRVVELSDPGAAAMGETSMHWGSLALNAFNRESHVAMDEVSDPPSARVVGSTPPPSRIYMTTEKARAQEIVSSGEVPDSVAGMSGQVLVICAHDFVLGAGESKELFLASIYNSRKLEDALSDFAGLSGSTSPPERPSPVIECSAPVVSEAASWALSTLEGAGTSRDLLDRAESFSMFSLFYPEEAKSSSEQIRVGMSKEGSLPHGADPSKPGILETAVYLSGFCADLVRGQDKKRMKVSYPTVKKLTASLLGFSKGFAVRPDPSLPQGWRRSIGRGFPTGEIPEVSLAVAEALAGASKVAKLVGKPGDAGGFLERSELISEGVKKRLVDDRGFLALCLDSSGRLRTEDTIDMAVAAYRHPFFQSAELAAAHRLLEKDFETPSGPRTVPKSNMLYFNRTYGKGQLGGFWSRAALAHVALCYRVGLAGMGSLGLQKVAKLVVEDQVRFGGSPTDIPYWFDPEAGEVHGDDSDPVASARFIEAIVYGDFGLQESEKPSFNPPANSVYTWVLASGMWLGERSTAFVGRASGKAHLFLSGSQVDGKGSSKFAKSEFLDLAARGLVALSFSGPGQIICVGNSSNSSARATVKFPPRAQELSKRLTTQLEEFDPSKGSWTTHSSMRVTTSMSFEAVVGPNDWKAYRVST